MSRKIFRVPLDFNAPLDQVWSGYVMPDIEPLPPCPNCNYDGTGSQGWSSAAWAMHEMFWPHRIRTWDMTREQAARLSWRDKLTQAEVDHLVAEGRLQQFVTWEATSTTERSWEWVTVPRTAAEVNAANAPGASEFSELSMSRGVGLEWPLIRFRCAQQGLPEYCLRCNGHGNLATDAEREARQAELDAWEPTEPPTGDGWQYWTTITEGSPLSPVFPTAEGLASWLVSWDCHPRDRMSSYAAALAFVGKGWAPSGFVGPDGAHSGPEVIAAMAMSGS